MTEVAADVLAADFLGLDATKLAIIVPNLLAGFALWSGFRQARQSRTHERTMAREARDQARLEATYVPMLRFAARVDQIVIRTLPILDQGLPVPPWPTDEEGFELEAQGRGFASREVVALLKAYGEARNAFMYQVELAKEVLDAKTGEPRVKIYQDVEEKRKAVLKASEALGERMNLELRGKASPDDGHANATGSSMSLH